MITLENPIILSDITILSLKLNLPNKIGLYGSCDKNLLQSYPFQQLCLTGIEVAHAQQWLETLEELQVIRSKAAF